METGDVVSGRLRTLREDRRLSVRELAAQLDAVGYRLLPSGVSKVENGDRKVSIGELFALALALKTTPAALLCDLDATAVQITADVAVLPADLLLWLWGEQTLPGEDDPVAAAAVHPGAQLLRHLLVTWRRARDTERQLAEFHQRDPATVRAEAARMVRKHGGTEDEYVTNLAADYERHAMMNRQLVQAIAGDLASIDVALPAQIADWLASHE